MRGTQDLSCGGTIRTCSSLTQVDLVSLTQSPLHLTYSVCWPGEPPSVQEVEVKATLLEHFGDWDNRCTVALLLRLGVSTVILHISFTHLCNIWAVEGFLCYLKKVCLSIQHAFTLVRLILFHHFTCNISGLRGDCVRSLKSHIFKQ